jgi:amino acid transporter
MLSVLLAAGTAHFGVSVWIGAAIAILFAMVVASYRQTIKAYPRGGGSYIVATDNLGSLAGLIAGSSLMIDYVLTVAVSVVSGVAALTSMSPGLSPFAVEMDLGFIILILLGNLRGIRESGSIFMLPTYFFILGVYAMIVAGTYHFAMTGWHVQAPVKTVAPVEALSAFLVLRAFASGCTALTGVEAISDGVPAFKPPEWRNARITILALGGFAITMFLGITLLVHAYGLVPNPGDADPTLISMLNRATLGSGVTYYYVQLTTAMILMLAANTAFSDFPRLAFFMARDSFLPHQFTLRGDRLSYSNGILMLGLLAILLIVVFKGSFEALVNLYVIGVFASFTLSQSGMVRRWLTRHEPGWRKGLMLNGTGAVLTFVVLLITAVTKFIYGAWLVVLLVPVMVTVFYRIRTHYFRSAEALRPRASASPYSLRHTVLVSGLQHPDQIANMVTYAATLRSERVVVIQPQGSAHVQDTDRCHVIEAERGPVKAALRSVIDAERELDAGVQITVLLAGVERGPLDYVRRALLRRWLLSHPRVCVGQVSPAIQDPGDRKRRTCLVPVARLNAAGLEALGYAHSLIRGRVLGVHIATEEEQDATKREWEAWGNHLPLVTIDSPYRAIVSPLRAYIDALGQAEAGQPITIVLPIVFAPGVLGRILHNHTANSVRRSLLPRTNTVVISVPYFIFSSTKA